LFEGDGDAFGALVIVDGEAGCGVRGRPVDFDEAGVGTGEAWAAAFVRVSEVWPALVDAAGGEVEDAVEAWALFEAEFGPVGVSGEEDDALGAGGGEEVEEAFAFLGEVGPCFVAVEADGELGGEADEAEGGGLFEFVFEPFPLGLA